MPPFGLPPGALITLVLNQRRLDLSFYGESLGGRGFVPVLSTNALQAPLESARGELTSDTRTLISP